MAGTSYTRQSTIADGNLITAALFNNEFNQIVNAFAYSASGTTGHTHDGSAGQGGAISKIGDQDFKNKIEVSITNNRIEFYSEVGGAPVEQVRIQDGAIVPVTDSDVDLGTTSVRFKDAYVDSVTVTNNIVVAGTVDGRDVATDGTKLDGIEASATADQTNAEIRAAVEAATDSNVFTDADHTKLNAIEASATADQTDAEIRAAVEAATDSNVFTDADHTKLNAIEASADVTDTTNVTAAGALMDSEVTNLAQVKAFDSSDYATAAQGTLATNALPKSGGAMTGAITTNSTFDGVDIATRDGVLTTTTTTANAALPKAGGAMTGAITTNSTFDGRDVAADGTKLDGIEASADVTDTANVVASLTAGSNITIAADGTIASTASGGNETLQQTLAIGNTTTTDTKIQFRDTGLYINSSADGQLDIVADTEVQIAATTVDVNGVLDVSGNIVAGGTVDGRDVATDGTKLDGIEANADVTDATNVTAAGALMDSELTAIASVKALNQGVATTDSPAFAGLTVDTNTLVVDSTNNRVSIGTTSPSKTLVINENDSECVVVIKSSDTGTAGLFLGGQTDEIKGGIVFDNSNNSLQLRGHDNAERMRIDSSGRVGIGTTSPEATLHIVDEGSTGPALHISGGSGTEGDITIPHDESLQIGHWNESTDTFIERIRMNTSGQVGIGTTTVGQFESTDVGLTVDSGNVYSGIAMTDGATTSTLTQGYSTTYLYNQANGGILFGTNNTERMRINSSGSVGIGTTAPSYALSVKGLGSSSVAASFESSVSTAWVMLKDSGTTLGNVRIGSSANRLIQYTGGSERLRIDSAGKVGIGTSSPAQALHVVGSIVATGNITAYYSDERLKNLIGTIPNALDKVSQLNGYYYTPNDTAKGLGVESKGVEVGVSAQEIETVLPEIIADSGVGTGYKTVMYEKITPLLIEAIKELTTKVNALETKLNNLEK
jgi:hypothetical protein